MEIVIVIIFWIIFFVVKAVIKAYKTIDNKIIENKEERAKNEFIEKRIENNKNVMFEVVDEIFVIAQKIKENDNVFRDSCKGSDLDVEMLNLVTDDLLSCYVRMEKVVSKDDPESLGVFYWASRCLGLSMSRNVSVLLEFEKYDKVCAYVEQEFAAMPDKYMLKDFAYWVNDDDFKIEYLKLLRKYANNLAKFDDKIEWRETSCLRQIESSENHVEYRTKVKDYFKYGITDSNILIVQIARYVVEKQRCTINDLQIQFLLKQKDVLKYLKHLEDYGIIKTMANGRKNVVVSTDEELQMIFLGEVVTEKEKVVKQEEKDVLPEKNQSNPIEKLNSLIGLNSVKSEIKSLENFLKVQIERDKQGLKQTSLSYHCVFTGNPGTGKTTVARILAEIYKNLGIIERGHLVETDRSGLVAEYVGQTAVKTNKIIDSALDGVLFIDEAYSLAVGSKIDYGNEAIATLLKRMEDNRDRLIVILAGYTDEMKTFIDSNPGLQSRFSRYIEFSDYSAEDLYKIFESKMKEEEYTITDEAKVYLQKFFADSVIHKDRNFGNGRFVRNIFEKVITQQSNRLASLPNLNSKILSEITIDDLK